MNWSRIKKYPEIVFFALFCIFFPFTIAYSHVSLATALGFSILFCLPFTQPNKTEKTLYWLCGAFVGLELLSGLVNHVGVDALFSLKEEWLFFVIPFTIHVFRKRANLNVALVAALVSTCVIAIYAWLQHFWGFDLRSDHALFQQPDGFYSAWGNFHNTLTFGNLFATLGAFFLAGGILVQNKLHKALSMGAGALASCAAVFSYSRGSILGVFAALIVMIFWMSRGMKISFVTVVVLSVAVLALSNSTAFERFKRNFAQLQNKYSTLREHSGSRLTIWSTSLEIIADNPVFGVGLQQFADTYERYDAGKFGRRFTHAHNDILNVAAYAGIPTAVVYLLIWLYMLRELYRAVRRQGASNFSRALALGAFAATVAFFVASQTEAAFADEEVRTGLMFIWGVGLTAIRLQSNSITDKEIGASTVASSVAS